MESGVVRYKDPVCEKKFNCCLKIQEIKIVLCSKKKKILVTLPVVA